MEVNGMKPETRGTSLVFRLPVLELFWYLVDIIGHELRRVPLLEIYLSIYLSIYVSIYVYLFLLLPLRT
jgi:hypothetical protein